MCRLTLAWWLDMDFKELRKRARKQPAQTDKPAGENAIETTDEDLELDDAMLAGEFGDSDFFDDDPVSESNEDVEPGEDAEDEEWDEEDDPDDDVDDSEEAEEIDDPDELDFDDDVDELVEILRFRLNKEFFAIYLEEIEEIVKPRGYTWVPRTPEWILGIVSLRGTMVPVVDLRRRLGIEINEGSAQRIIVVTFYDEPCGLLVDEVNNVERINPERLEQIPAALTDTAGKFLSDLIRIDDELIALISLDTVLDRGESSDERAA